MPRKNLLRVIDSTSGFLVPNICEVFRHPKPHYLHGCQGLAMDTMKGFMVETHLNVAVERRRNQKLRARAVVFTVNFKG